MCRKAAGADGTEKLQRWFPPGSLGFWNWERPQAFVVGEFAEHKVKFTKSLAAKVNSQELFRRFIHLHSN